MAEENIFEELEEILRLTFEEDWDLFLDEMEDYEEPEELERLKKLAEMENRFPVEAISLQQLMNLEVYPSLSSGHSGDAVEFYRSMANMHGTKVVDGTKYAVMDDFAYHYFGEIMTVEAIDSQGNECVLIYALREDWQERERQDETDREPDEDAGDWDHPGMVVSMTAFRNEMIQRTAREFQKNGAPLFVQCLSKRTFRKKSWKNGRLLTGCLECSPLSNGLRNISRKMNNWLS